MEEKILNAIQHIKSKCKKRVTSQRIYSFINKGALSQIHEKILWLG